MNTKKIKEYVGDVFTSAHLQSDAHAFRDAANSSGSALYSLFNHLKSQIGNLQNPTNRAKFINYDDSFVEQYSLDGDDGIITLKITTFRHGTIYVSPVKNFESAIQIQRMRMSLDKSGMSHISALVDQAFKQCADSSVFQTEVEDGEWSIYFNDPKNRIMAVLGIHSTIHA